MANVEKSGNGKRRKPSPQPSRGRTARPSKHQTTSASQADASEKVEAATPQENARRALLTPPVRRGLIYVILFSLAAALVLVANYAIRSALSTSYRERLQSADYFLENGEYSIALEKYQALMRERGESAELYRRMANASLGMQKVEDARTYYEKAAALDPQDAESRYQLALIAMQEGNEKEAERWARESARARANFLAPRIFLGKLYQKQNRVDEALSMFLEVLKLNPAIESGRKDLFKSLGQLYEARGNKQQAIYYYQQALALDPLDDEVRERLKSLGAIMTR